jgi:hypothetical protein
MRAFGGDVICEKEMMQLVWGDYCFDFPKHFERVTDGGIEFDRRVKQQATVHQADAGHPRSDFRANNRQLERSIYHPEICA